MLTLDSDMTIEEVLEDSMVPYWFPEEGLKLVDIKDNSEEGFCRQYKGYSVHPAVYYPTAFELKMTTRRLYPLYACCCSICNHKRFF